MKKFLVAGAMALALSGCASQQPELPFTLTLAHIGDTQSRFDASDARLELGGQAVYAKLGGFPRLLTQADSLRQQAEIAGQPLLFVHAGDAWQGSGYFRLNQGAMNADLLSRLGLDAMVPGEREFSLDNRRLAAFINNLGVPVLAANLDARREPALSGSASLLPYVLYAFDGHDKERLESMDDAGSDPVVAVFGLVAEDLTGHTGKLGIGHEVEAAQQTVNALRAKGVKHIVALAHIGDERSLALASSVNGIDLIVAGHQDGQPAVSLQAQADGQPPYARLITNPNGRARTCVVQAAPFAGAMGRVSVTFSRDGRVTRCEGGNTLLTGGDFYHDVRRLPEHRLEPAGQQRLAALIAADPQLAIVQEDAALRRLIDEQYRPALNAAYGEVIGHVPAALMHRAVPGADNNGSELAPLVAASQLSWVNSPEVQAITGRHADFALVNAGAVRSGLATGELKEGHVSLELLPAARPLSLLSLTGRQVAGLLLEGINGALPEGADGQSFPYAAGLRYRFDETRKGAGFLRRIEVRQNGAWVRLEPDASYQVVMNADSASGLGGWRTLFHVQQLLTDRVDLAWTDGRLTAFPVSRLSRTPDGATQVHYLNRALHCRAAAVSCNTEARAFIDYVRNAPGLVTALPEQSITLNRL